MMAYKELQELKELVDEGNSAVARLLAQVELMAEAASFVGVFEHALTSAREMIRRFRGPFHQVEIRINEELQKAPGFLIKNMTAGTMQILGTGEWMEPGETTNIPWHYRFLDYYKNAIDEKGYFLIISEEEQDESSQ